jgi:hypothetical protein
MKLLNKFFRNTRLEKHAPLGASPNPGGSTPITGNTFAGGAAGPAVTPAFATGLQGCFGMQYVDVVLSSAQILALLGTPVTLVPAPGAGFSIVPVSAKVIVFGGSAAYTDVGGAVQFVVGGRVYALASNAVFLTVATPNRQVLQTALTGVVGAAGNPPSDDNAALQINKITNNFAAGTGTAKITIYYTIEPTT